MSADISLLRIKDLRLDFDLTLLSLLFSVNGGKIKARASTTRSHGEIQTKAPSHRYRCP